MSPPSDHIVSSDNLTCQLRIVMIITILPVLALNIPLITWQNKYVYEGELPTAGLIRHACSVILAVFELDLLGFFSKDY
jgi:hypothetical protein